MGWDKHKKPPTDFCPGRYCFHWVPAGGVADVSGGGHRSLDEVLQRRDGWADFPDGGCGCRFGLCSRIDPVAGDHDWYEPCEPALEREGLPWFYFIASAGDVGPEFRERYQSESTKLWGKKPKPIEGDE